MPSNNVDLPQIVFCTREGFKKKVLLEMGLKENSFHVAQFRTYQKNKDLKDIKDIWDNATYSQDEFAIAWHTIEGLSNIQTKKCK